MSAPASRAAVLLLLALAPIEACSNSDPTGTPTSRTASSASASNAPATSTEAVVRAGEPWLVYQTGGDGSALRLVRPDGSDDHFLMAVRLPGDEAHPTWSPDGSRVAFDVAVDEPNGQVRGSIWVANADGTEAHEIASCVRPCLQLAYPSWSPDGSTIAMGRYDSRPDQSWGPSAVELLDVETGGRTVVWETADGRSHVQEADWSPDGSSLVTTLNTFNDERRSSLTSRSVVVIGADGSTKTPIRISRQTEFAGEPDWGPSGQIAYTSTPTAERLQPTDLVVTGPDGSSRQRISSSAFEDLVVFEPEWSADGTRLRVSTDDGTTARMGLATVTVEDESLVQEPWTLRTSPGGPWATHVHERPIAQ